MQLHINNNHTWCSFSSNKKKRNLGLFLNFKSVNCPESGKEKNRKSGIRTFENSQTTGTGRDVRLSPSFFNFISYNFTSAESRILKKTLFCPQKLLIIGPKNFSVMPTSLKTALNFCSIKIACHATMYLILPR